VFENGGRSGDDDDDDGGVCLFTSCALVMASSALYKHNLSYLCALPGVFVYLLPAL